MEKQVYIIDDDQAIRRSLGSLLEDQEYLVTTFPDTRPFQQGVNSEITAVLLLDIALPGEDGLSFLKRLRDLYPMIETIMITGEATIDRAVAATKLGAYDFLEKPIQPPRLLLTLENLFESLTLRAQLAEARAGEDSSHAIIGESDVVRNLRRVISQVATTNSTVLVIGENGTGKELVAYQLWAQSSRSDKPYIRVNCAALPRDLAESELFGFRKGAFTGADRNRDGKFKAADKGTILLDEIGDLSPEVQAKLLRILESGEIEPLGADNAETVDVRVIAATNRDLEKEVAEGRFRNDLFYRLNVVPIEVPPLRERRDDIPLLVEHFRQVLAQNTGLGGKEFTADAVGVLAGLEYRGNVRELKNLLERIFIMNRGRVINSDDIVKMPGEREQIANDSTRNKLTQAVNNFERSFLTTELTRHNDNISSLAKSLEMDRGNLSKKLKGYGLV